MFARGSSFGERLSNTRCQRPNMVSSITRGRNSTCVDLGPEAVAGDWTDVEYKRLDRQNSKNLQFTLNNLKVRTVFYIRPFKR